MSNDELKELIRTEPTVASTFAAVDAEFTAAVAHSETLATRHTKLKDQLDRIAAAKQGLGRTAKPAEKSKVKKTAK